MIHIERTHTIEIPMDPDAALPLFTPLGELTWIDEWNPEFIHPANGETREGMVFRTTDDGEATLWTCTRWDTNRRRATYARVTPSSRFGIVDVCCRPAAGGATAVTVTYEYTALTDKGVADNERLTEQSFKGMVDDWRQLIVTQFGAD